MRSYLIFLSVLTLLYFTEIYGQSSVQEEWIRFYAGTESYCVGRDIFVDQFGNAYVTGYGTRAGNYHDFITIKYSIDGIEHWVAYYSGPTNYDDEGVALALDHYGNVYVTGTSRGTVAFNDIATIKYDPNGVEQWISRYTSGQSGGISEPTAIAVDDSGNVYVTGSSSSPSSSYGITIKYNTDGVEQWVAIYSVPGNNWSILNALVLDDLGYIYVTGGSGDLSGSAIALTEFITVKYDSDGIEQWDTRYFGPTNFHDEATAITIDIFGNVYVTGSSCDTDYDYATIKYSENGNQIWVSRYDGPGPYLEEPTAIAADDSGNVYVTGRSFGSSSAGYDYATVKYNCDGIQQWASRYNGSGDAWDYANDISLDDLGNVYVTGWSVETGTSEDYTTVKYNTNGVEEWIIHFNCEDNVGDFANAMAMDTLGNIYVTGISFKSSGKGVCTTIKYNQNPALVGDYKSSKVDEFYIFPNYPNPFNSSTKIEYNLPRTEKVKIEVFNILGQRIETLINKSMPAGSNEVEFTAKDLPSGVYYYKIETEEFREVRKMLLIR